MNIYIVVKPFGAYSPGDRVQFNDEDAKRFKDYLEIPKGKPEEKLGENKKAPASSKK